MSDIHLFLCLLLTVLCKYRTPKIWPKNGWVEFHPMVRVGCYTHQGWLGGFSPKAGSLGVFSPKGEGWVENPPMMVGAFFTQCCDVEPPSPPLCDDVIFEWSLIIDFHID